MQVRDTKFFRFIRNKYFIVSLLFILWITFFSSNNLIQWSQVVLNVSEQESQKRYYKEAIKAIDEKLNELSSNKDSLEKFAREQYLFKEENEDIFIVEENK